MESPAESPDSGGGLERERQPGLLEYLVWAVLALAVRLPAAHHDLWLDEIWSMRMAATLSHVGDVFTLHHDNNHY